MIVVLIILLFYIILCYFIFGLIFKSSYSFVLNNISKKLDEILLPYKHVYIEAYIWIKHMNPEVLSIKSHDKLNLTGLYIKNKKETCITSYT